MPLSDTRLRFALRFLEPWRRYVRPVFVGMERVPVHTRPLLFVGNHTLYGVLDVPLLFAELYARHGIFPHALGDHVPFRIPGWRAVISSFGVVDGTRENAARLLSRGEPVLVFPGGGREVAKRKGEKYALLWKERLGFARLAIEHGATIVPFSAVGAEEAYDIAYDANDLFASLLGPLARRLPVRDAVWFPLSLGLAGTPFPKRERFYFEIGHPIDARRYGADAQEANCRALRDEARHAVQQGIDSLLALRHSDPARYVP